MQTLERQRQHVRELAAQLFAAQLVMDDLDSDPDSSEPDRIRWGDYVTDVERQYNAALAALPAPYGNGPVASETETPMKIDHQIVYRDGDGNETVVCMQPIEWDQRPESYKGKRRRRWFGRKG